MKDFNLNTLLEFARRNQVSIQINYSECEDSLELEVISAAPAECYYMKRCSDIDYFIEKWAENLAENIKAER